MWAGVCYAQPGYSDAAACAGCHRRIADSYARTGMGRSFRRIPRGAALAEFDGRTFYHQASGEHFVAYRKEGMPYLRRHQIGFGGAIANVLDARVDYIFGSGNHARSYVHRTPGGRLIELPLTWYAEKGGYWAMSPAFDRAEHPGFSRAIVYRCMFCHNGYPALTAGADESDYGTDFPERLPEGIDCQRCHGPGAEHARTSRASDIVNPARLPAARQMEICMQCHLETTSAQLPAMLLRAGRGVFSYRPGEALENYVLHFDHAPDTQEKDKFELVSAVYRLRKSACFRSGALTCTTCHDPHQAAANYSQSCVRCHSAPHTDGDCVSCHMPKRRPADAVHIVITDHYIQARPRPAVVPQEQHDGNTPHYRGHVALYYPSQADKLDLAFADVAHEPEVLARLIGKNPVRPDALFALAEHWFRAGAAGKALPLYERAIKARPESWRYLWALGIARRDASILEQARVMAPRETALLLALGDVYFAAARYGEAATAIRQAIALDPEMAEGPNNLGNVLLRQGDLTGAEAALREALRLRPENSRIRLNLGIALVAAGKSMEARWHLDIAARSSDAEVRQAALAVR